jgi:Capsule assembly protein Wzi
VSTERRIHTIALCCLTFAGTVIIAVQPVRASTYCVYIPLDSPIYDELDTLNGLGLLDTYLAEVRPITRVEAARLTLEAERNLEIHQAQTALARSFVRSLRDQLSEEIGWLEQSAEDGRPATLHPLERVEAGYVFSSGEHRAWNSSGPGGIHANEATPLLPNDDALPIAPGSNEVLRAGGWAGVGSFLTAYGEGAASGPFTREIPGRSRVRLLSGEAVADFGNVAISFGQREMWWGTGHFAALSQGDNAEPFPALRIQNVHPTLLPSIFRYLGQFRFEIFFGQLDGMRKFAHPWIDGEIFAFKPLPTFEIGFTHAIMFGGRFNDRYSLAGFFGRATGFATGNPDVGNTNSRAGVYLKFYIPSLRGMQIYQEIVGEDNLTTELPPVGRFLPFLAVSYQGGIYLPRLTADGLTDLRFEYALLEPGYSIHSDSLYWTSEGRLMGDPLGPNASEVNLEIGRWFGLTTKAGADLFYTEQAPTWGSGTPFVPVLRGQELTKEHGGGVAFDLLHLPCTISRLGNGLAAMRARAAVEYAQDLNYQPNTNSIRFLLTFSGAFTPGWSSWMWQ